MLLFTGNEWSRACPLLWIEFNADHPPHKYIPFLLLPWNQLPFYHINVLYTLFLLLPEHGSALMHPTGLAALRSA
ncbi:MAG TPA: hypothetical protein VH593_03080, partial [Ktedonobacteraceae bacterium]